MVVRDPRYPGGPGYQCLLCGHLFPRPLLTRLFNRTPSCPGCGNSSALQPVERHGCVIIPVGESAQKES